MLGMGGWEKNTVTCVTGKGGDNNGSNIEKGFGFHIERIEMKKGS